MNRKLMTMAKRALLGILAAGFVICLQGKLVDGTIAYAAPKQMADGGYFDPEFYATTYPDVFAAFGMDENLLYAHYLTFGVNEGRIPYEGSTPIGKPLEECTKQELVAMVVNQVVKPDMDPVAIAVAFNDYLIEHCEYDYTYTHYTCRDALALGTAVCQGYASAYRELMNAAGIPTDYVRGYGYSQGDWGRHGWNRSLIGGAYYYTDVTWNDTMRQNHYLLMSLEQISPDHQQTELNPWSVE